MNSPDPTPEPERERPIQEREIQRPQLDPISERQSATGNYRESNSGSFTDLPTFEDKPRDTTGGGSGGGKKKKPSWLLPIIGAVCILGAIGIGVAEHNSSSNNPNPPTPHVQVDQQQQQIITVCGADLDQATTQQAVADLKAGTANPLTDNLSAAMKQELLDGTRSFYKIPTSSAQNDNSDQSGDRVEIDFNGTMYGTYTVTKDPISLDMPLKIGDRTDVKCISVASGKSNLTVDLGTALNPVETRALAPGETETFTVTQNATAQNYDWFTQEANQGNAVAQYGLGHMYQYGIGVAQDRNQAIHWYQMAAAQNYQDAASQLAKLTTSQ